MASNAGKEVLVWVDASEAECGSSAWGQLHAIVGTSIVEHRVCPTAGFLKDKITEDLARAEEYLEERLSDIIYHREELARAEHEVAELEVVVSTRRELMERFDGFVAEALKKRTLAAGIAIPRVELP